VHAGPGVRPAGLRREDPVGSPAKNPYLDVDGTMQPFTGLQPTILANDVASFISLPSTQPFYAMYTPTTPHLPADDPSYESMPVAATPSPAFDQETRTIGTPTFERRQPLDAAEQAEIVDDDATMSRAVRGLDDDISTILNALGSRASDTFIVYISDNGFHYGEHRRMGKTTLFEEASGCRWSSSGRRRP
jgi:arylsulfatase A-like enzyme